MTDSLHIVCPHCDGINRLPANRVASDGKCGRCHKPLFDGLPVELGDSNFRRHIDRSDIPVVVDFWASWCGPCKMMAPIFSQAAEQLQPHFRLAKVNTEKHQTIASEHRIQSIPTLAIFKQGREVARQSGAMDLAGLTRWIKQFQ